VKKPSVTNILSLTTKRVTDFVLEQSRRAFWESGIELDAKMISIVTLTYQAGSMTSTRLADETGLSRQLVESRLRCLVKDGYLDEKKDPDDLRRRVYLINEAKVGDVERAINMVAEFEAVYDACWDELGFDLQQGLRDLEKALRQKSLLARVREQQGTSE
jgi:DNA-binding MarR family transcriptional regulator